LERLKDLVERDAIHHTLARLSAEPPEETHIVESLSPIIVVLYVLPSGTD
jgi:hypothetical protein